MAIRDNLDPADRAHLGRIPTRPQQGNGMPDRAKQAWAQRMQGQADFYTQHGYVPSDPNMARRAAPNPLDVLRAQQQAAEDARRRLISQATERYRRLNQEQVQSALAAINADTKAQQSALTQQLNALDPARARALDQVNRQRAADVTQVNQAALRSGMVNSGMRAQGQSQVLANEAQAETLVEENYRQQRTQLQSQIEMLAAEAARRRAEARRQAANALAVLQAQLAASGGM